VLLADLANRADRIHRVRCCRAYGGAYEAWSQASIVVRFDLPRQCFGPHREVLVDVNSAKIVNAYARYHRCFLQGGMRLRGSVGHQLSIASFFITDIASCPLAGREQRAQSRARSCILDDASARARRKT